MPKDMLDDKVGILDIKAKIDNTINCDIEMQVVDEKNVEKRITFYVSRMYTQTIHEGQDYSELQKCVAILITDYEISSLKKLQKYVTKWNLREEYYVDKVLTDDIKIYIIKLPKVEKYKKGIALDQWVEFIKDPKVMNMSNSEIKKAKEVLEKISKDKDERRLAELREKYIRDQKAIEGAGYDKGLNDGMKKGIEQGIQQGIKQGIEQGIEQGIQQGTGQGIKQGEQNKTIEIAKKMKDEGFDINQIIKITNLSVEEIEKL